MRSRVGRIATTAILAAGVGVSSVVFTAPAAEAAQPVVAGDCNATVTGAPGQPVSLDLGAVLGTGHGPLIPVGVIPQQGAKAINAAPMVKDAASKGLLGGLLGGVTQLLANGCAVTAKVATTAAAPVQSVAKPVTDAAKPVTTPVTQTVQQANKALQLPDNSQDAPPSAPAPGQPPATPPTQPGGTPPAPTGGVPGVPLPGQAMPTGLPNVFSPAALYNSIPLGGQSFGAQGFGVPGSFAPPPGTQYGLQIPGYAPTTGQLGAPPAAPGWANADPVRNAGSAEALDTPKDNNSPVGLPLLLAVIALAGVTAGLVRTYLLRKARA